MGQVSVWKCVTEMEDLCTKGAEEWLSVKNGGRTSFPRTQCCAARPGLQGSARGGEEPGELFVQIHFDNSFYIFISLLLQI